MNKNLSPSLHHFLCRARSQCGVVFLSLSNFFSKRNSNLILNLLGINFFLKPLKMMYFHFLFNIRNIDLYITWASVNLYLFLFQYLSLVLIKIPFNYKINLNEQESDEVDPRLSSVRDTSFSWESIDSQAGSRQSLLDNKGRCRLLSVSQSRLGATQVRVACI